MRELSLKSYDFVTLYTHQHRPMLADALAKQAFLDALIECKQQFGLSMAAYVLLDDHVHLLYTAPEGTNQGAILGHLRGSHTRIGKPHLPEGEPVWQKAVEVRNLKDSKSIRAHIDYIHYDPVWHGRVRRAADYPWSSLPARIEQGLYASNWAELAPPAAVVKLVHKR
jgi:putative transposase